MSSRILVMVCALAAAAAGACTESRADMAEAGGMANPGMMQGRAPMAHSARFSGTGELQRPRGYRSWVYVGAPLTPNDMNNGKAAFPEFHSVYIDPASFEHYKRHGTWRDGTVLVKELVSVGSKAASSGAGYFMGEFLGLEVALKDATRFPEESGHWGYFRFTDESGGPPRQTATSLPAAACAACHIAGAADDLVFTQYYPVLRAAKNAGAKTPEDS